MQSSPEEEDIAQALNTSSVFAGISKHLLFQVHCAGFVCDTWTPALAVPNLVCPADPLLDETASRTAAAQQCQPCCASDGGTWAATWQMG